MTNKAESKTDDTLAELLAECEGVDMTPCAGVIGVFTLTRMTVQINQNTQLLTEGKNYA